MADEATATLDAPAPETPAAEASPAPPAAATAEPKAEESASDTLLAAFKAQADKVDAKPAEQPSADPAAASEGEPAAEALKPEDAGAEPPAKPEEPAPEASKPGYSRRATAEIANLTTERDTFKSRAETAEQRLAALEQRQQAAAQAALGTLGDEQEYQRLLSLNAKSEQTGEYLSREDGIKLAQMHAAREHADGWRTLALQLADSQAGERFNAFRAGFVGDLVDKLGAAVAKHGLDGAFCSENAADYAAVIDHAVETVASPLRAQIDERDDRIAELETQLKAATTQAAASARSLERGGRSAGIGSPAPDRNASAREDLMWAFSRTARRSA